MKQPDQRVEFLKAYDAFGDAIFRHCYFRVSDGELAKDLTQETFIRVWKCIAEGTEIKHMRGFLYRVAHNLIVDEYRKRRSHSLSLDELQEKGFHLADEKGDKIQARMEAKDMLVLLEKLDPKYRDVVIMRYIDELSPREIGEILGEAENTVSVQIHRALKQARALLENNEKHI